MPVGVGLHDGFGLNRFQAGEILKGFCGGEISFAGISKVGGTAQEQRVGLPHLEEAGLGRRAQQMGLIDRHLYGAWWRVSDQGQRCGFVTMSMSDDESLTQVEVRDFESDFFMPHLLEKAMQQNG